MSGQIEDWIDQVGPGWAGILTELDADLQRVSPGYTVNQIKEKFGTLRAYISAPPETFDAVQDLVRAAEKKSESTCEQCGEPGELCRPRRWYLTLCINCREAAQAA